MLQLEKQHQRNTNKISTSQTTLCVPLAKELLHKKHTVGTFQYPIVSVKFLYHILKFFWPGSFLFSLQNEDSNCVEFFLTTLEP
jgi:hypothetical protein